MVFERNSLRNAKKRIGACEKKLDANFGILWYSFCQYAYCVIQFQTSEKQL